MIYRKKFKLVMDHNFIILAPNSQVNEGDKQVQEIWPIEPVKVPADLS